MACLGTVQQDRTMVAERHPADHDAMARRAMFRETVRRKANRP